MKKLLVGTAAVAMGLALAAPANAQVKLDLGGHFKGYVSWVDQDDATFTSTDITGPTTTVTTSDVNSFDILRETEIHFTGETTLDNGLTVGFHHEANVDLGEFETEESYLYMSGHWGRVNFGAEDGASYLLQVAAPSADSNIDGIRQYINPVNMGGIEFTDGLGNVLASFNFSDPVDYDNGFTGASDKITYLTPVFSGFQAGVSYTPEVGSPSRSFGNVLDDDLGDAYEVAARYEGQFENVGFAIGAGYTHIEEDTSAPGDKDFKGWNIGLDVDWGPFGVGVVYTEHNNALTGNNDSETWVIGADYTTGPYKIGASYLYNDDDSTTIETDRFTAGVVYTYGPGMTFRGSLGYVDYDGTGGFDFDATYALVGTQVNF